MNYLFKRIGILILFALGGNLIPDLPRKVTQMMKLFIGQHIGLILSYELMLRTHHIRRGL